MSIETIAVTLAPKFLGGLAVPIAKAIGKKVTFPFEVWWKVRAQLPFRVSFWPYRRWLKSLSEQEIRSPIASSGSEIVQRLDELMTTGSKDWAAANDHLSRAAELAEATFPTMVACMGKKEEALVTASWLQEHGSELRRLLLGTCGPDAALSDHDYAELLLDFSRARRAVRLQAFELDERRLSKFFDRLPSVDVASGSVRVLMGDYGSGKSEIAECWHRHCVDDYSKNEDAPVPVWLNCRDLSGSNIMSAVEANVRHRLNSHHGLRIVIDGLDEVFPGVANQVLDDARILVMSRRNVAILITSRPGVITPQNGEKEDVKLLTPQEARELVGELANLPHLGYLWDESIRESIRRPFFALAAGSLFANGVAIDGEIGLIRVLVENALSRGSERAVLTTSSTRDVLMDLACNLTMSGQDQFGLPQRLQACSSRLVATASDGTVHFSLPVFQHWFASESLKAGRVDPGLITRDAKSFARWKWSASLAIQSCTDSDAADRFLGDWVSTNPGAASWILDSAFGARSWPRRPDVVVDQKIAEMRLLQSFKVWCGALGGEIVASIFPEGIRNDGINLGIKVSKDLLWLSFARNPEPGDRIVAGPDFGILNRITAEDSWLPWLQRVIPSHAAWPWLVVWSLVKGGMDECLRSNPYLGDANGVWVREHDYEIGSRIAKVNFRAFEVVPRKDLLERIEELKRVALDEGFPFEDSVYGSDRKFVNGRELDALAGRLRAGMSDLEPLLFKADQIGMGPTFFSWFSNTRLLENVIAVYANAITAYEEACRNGFASFSWSLSKSSLSPFGIYLKLYLGERPAVSVLRAPMSILGLACTIPEGAQWSTDGRVAGIVASRMDDFNDGFDEYTKQLLSWGQAQEIETIEISGELRVLDCLYSSRPATSVAAGWLHADLTKLGLCSGVFMDVS